MTQEPLEGWMFDGCEMLGWQKYIDIFNNTLYGLIYWWKSWLCVSARKFQQLCTTTAIECICITVYLPHYACSFNWSAQMSEVQTNEVLLCWNIICFFMSVCQFQSTLTRTMKMLTNQSAATQMGMNFNPCTFYLKPLLPCFPPSSKS